MKTQTRKRIKVISGIMLCLLVLSACGTDKSKEAKKTKEDKVSQKNVAALSDNNYSSGDNSMTMNNETLSSPDFELTLTSMAVTQNESGRYLTVYFTYTNKTDIYETGSKAVNRYFVANQSPAKGDVQTLAMSEAGELGEHGDQLVETLKVPQEKNVPVNMAVTYKTISEEDVRLDFLDAAQNVIVSKNYLIKQD